MTDQEDELSRTGGVGCPGPELLLLGATEYGVCVMRIDHQPKESHTMCGQAVSTSPQIMQLRSKLHSGGDERSSAQALVSG